MEQLALRVGLLLSLTLLLAPVVVLAQLRDRNPRPGFGRVSGRQRLVTLKRAFTPGAVLVAATVRCWGRWSRWWRVAAR